MKSLRSASWWVCIVPRALLAGPIMVCAACGATSLLPTGGHPPGDAGGTALVDATDASSIVDAGTTHVDAGTVSADAGTVSADAGTTHVDAGTTHVDAGTTHVDAGTLPVDGGAVATLHRSVRVSAEGVVVRDAGGTTVDLTSPIRAASFQTRPGEVTLVRAVWLFTRWVIRIPDGYALSSARLVIHGASSVAPVDVRTFAHDGVFTGRDFDRPWTSVGHIVGPSGDDGSTWTFDITASVASILTGGGHLGVRAQLMPETIRGMGTNTQMLFGEVRIELDFARMP